MASSAERAAERIEILRQVADDTLDLGMVGALPWRDVLENGFVEWYTKRSGSKRVYWRLTDKGRAALAHAEGK